MLTQGGKVMLVMQQSSLESILQIINHQIGYELHQAGVPTMPNIPPCSCATEHAAAVAAIHHHHDVLYQRGVNQGLKSVSQLGEAEVRKFEIEEGSDVMEEIVGLVNVFAKVSLHKETGLRGGVAPSNVDVVGTSKKAEEERLVAALEAYRTALRKKAWEMVEEEEEEEEKGGGGKGSEVEGVEGEEEGQSDPEDLALSSEGEQ